MLTKETACCLDLYEGDMMLCQTVFQIKPEKSLIIMFEKPFSEEVLDAIVDFYQISKEVLCSDLQTIFENPNIAGLPRDVNLTSRFGVIKAIVYSRLGLDPPEDEPEDF